VLRLESAGVQQIDLLVATSPRADASGGCADVMNYLGVGQVLWSGAPGTTAAWTAFQGLFQAGPALIVNAGSSQVGDWGPVRARVFNPPATSDPSSLTDTDGSLVLALDYAGYRVLLSGPIHTAGERAALDAGLGSGPVTVLAVPDHGAATATSDALVNAVLPPGGNTSPRFAVISNAAKDPAQPDPKVIGRLQAAGAQVLSTAANGMVTITLPGAGGPPALQTER
jgi:competence protein ComEC